MNGNYQITAHDVPSDMRTDYTPEQIADAFQGAINRGMGTFYWDADIKQDPWTVQVPSAIDAVVTDGAEEVMFYVREGIPPGMEHAASEYMNAIAQGTQYSPIVDSARRYAASNTIHQAE